MPDAQYPEFVRDGHLTTDGQQVVEFMTAQFEEADKTNNLTKLNSLHGPIAEYYTLVYKLHMKTPENWMATLPQSARNAHDLMQYVAEEARKSAQVAENTQTTHTLEQELTLFKASVGEEMDKLRGELARLTEENAVLRKPAGKGKKGAEAAAEAETEA